MLRVLTALALSGALSACTTIDASKEHTSALYFGIVRVVTPKSDANAAAAGTPVTALDAEAVGVRIENGIGAGYFHDQNYEVPTDCRVVIFVQTQEQLDQLSHQFADFKEGICGTVKPS